MCSKTQSLISTDQIAGSSSLIWGFPCGSVGKEFAWIAGEQEDPQEREIATHSSILDWEIPWTVQPDGLQSMGLYESDMT